MACMYVLCGPEASTCNMLFWPGCTAAGWSETILSHGLTAAEAAHTAVVTAVVTAFGYTCSVWDYQRLD